MATPTLGGSPAVSSSAINGSGVFPTEPRFETTFRAIAKTSFSEDGGLVLLGGSFAPGVVTEYRVLSSSRSAWALVPSSQLQYWMRLKSLEVRAGQVPPLRTFGETLLYGGNLGIGEVGEDGGEKN